MPGFVVTVGKRIILPPHEKDARLTEHFAKGEDFEIAFRTSRKFSNDKFLLEQKGVLILLDGVIVNNHQLMEKY